MLFTYPIWLLGLLPWSAAAVLLFLGRRPKWDVPFLQLWQLQMPKEAARRKFPVPPAGVVLGLVAALLAIVASAGPGIRGAAGSAETVVIVDTGNSMSATGAGGSPRFRELLAACGADLTAAGGSDLPVRLIAVPSAMIDATADSAMRTTAGQLASKAEALHPSALASGDQLTLAIQRVLAESSLEAVLVVTDRPLVVADQRLTVIAPERAPRNVGIMAFALRRSPRPQAMVRIGRTGVAGDKQTVKLRITSGGRSVEQEVQQPAAGASRDIFVTLATAGATGTAELLDAKDDFPADDHADLLAEVDWPTLEPATPIGELRRLAELYAAVRPPGERSIHLRLAVEEKVLGTSPGVVLVALASPARPTRVTTVAAHPVTQLIGDWRSFEMPAAESRKLPEGRWTTLLGDERGPLLTVRELGSEPGAERATRQVWTALDVAGWSNRPEYVVFWSALFDWAGHAEAGGDRLIASPLAELTSQWRPVELSPGPADARYWPGIYERPSDGTRRAFGPALAFEGTMTLSPAERANRLAALLRRGEHVTPLSPWLLLAALGAIIAAAAVWKRAVRPTAQARRRDSDPQA